MTKYVKIEFSLNRAYYYALNKDFKVLDKVEIERTNALRFKELNEERIISHVKTLRGEDYLIEIK